MEEIERNQLRRQELQRREAERRQRREAQQEISSLERMIKETMQLGEFNDAARYADKLLLLVEQDSGHWNHGSLKHLAHITLGHCALQHGDLPRARRHLLESANIDGGTTISSFGPDMSLAQSFLRQGETDIVLEYFEHCRRFWRSHNGKLQEWRDLVRIGRIPQFGGNLSFFVRLPDHIADNRTIPGHYTELPQTETGAASMPQPLPAVSSATGRQVEAQDAEPSLTVKLTNGWDSSMIGGTATAKDLIRLFSDYVRPSSEMTARQGLQLYRNVTYLMPFNEAIKALNLTGSLPSKNTIACAPSLRSFSYYSFEGAFEGGANRLNIVTDLANQVVAIHFVNERPSGKGPYPATQDWHTYNFINCRTRASSEPLIRHEVRESGNTEPGERVFKVESAFWQPVKRSYKCSETSTWYVPEQICSLMLFAAQNSIAR